ncbi:MAG: hypothetical protein JXB48_22025 [Candidatus Latescibacteria bacterium]|nr:hypothetical protein [Candidatus Latescibacterota bacterium]
MDSSVIWALSVVAFNKKSEHDFHDKNNDIQGKIKWIYRVVAISTAKTYHGHHFIMGICGSDSLF